MFIILIISYNMKASQAGLGELVPGQIIEKDLIAKMEEAIVAYSAWIENKSINQYHDFNAIGTFRTIVERLLAGRDSKISFDYGNAPGLITVKWAPTKFNYHNGECGIVLGNVSFDFSRIKNTTTPMLILPSNFAQLIEAVIDYKNAKN